MPTKRDDLLPLGDTNHGYHWLHDSSGAEVGIIEYHGTDEGDWCAGSVRWEGPHAKHRLVQREPLTIEPSLLCTLCGSHGWIREGRWVNA